ncbi:MAG: phage holin family protein [Acidobacteria bacterium]|nr:phage holin family protein [Acidobacteriota bacterium]
MGFLVRVLLNGAAIVAAAWLVPGVHLAGVVPALVAGAILGVVNALIRPLLLLLTLPFTLAALVPGFDISVLGGVLRRTARHRRQLATQRAGTETRQVVLPL